MARESRLVKAKSRKGSSMRREVSKLLNHDKVQQELLTDKGTKGSVVCNTSQKRQRPEEEYEQSNLEKLRMIHAINLINQNPQYEHPVPSISMNRGFFDKAAQPKMYTMGPWSQPQFIPYSGVVAPLISMQSASFNTYRQSSMTILPGFIPSPYMQIPNLQPNTMFGAIPQPNKYWPM